MKIALGRQNVSWLILLTSFLVAIGLALQVGETAAKALNDTTLPASYSFPASFVRFARTVDWLFLSLAVLALALGSALAAAINPSARVREFLGKVGSSTIFGWFFIISGFAVHILGLLGLAALTVVITPSPAKPPVYFDVMLGTTAIALLVSWLCWVHVFLEDLSNDRRDYSLFWVLVPLTLSFILTASAALETYFGTAPGSDFVWVPVANLVLWLVCIWGLFKS